MNHKSTSASKKVIKNCPRLFVLVLLLLVLAGHAYSQDTSSNPLDGYTPSGLAPGAPAGSYSLSGFDTINPYSGGMTFSLPLLNIGGRGSAGYTMRLPIDQKWSVTHSTSDDGQGHYYDFYDAEFNAFITGTRAGYGPGALYGRQVGSSYQYCDSAGSYLPTKTLTRFTFVTPDGTEYELRDVQTDGHPFYIGVCGMNGSSRGKVFKTADGSSATFISDQPVIDTPFIYSGIIGADGYLFLRDGTRYRIDGGFVTWMTDRNGNKVSFEYNGAGVTSIKDSLNRQVTIEYNVNDVAPYGLCDRITYKGFGGATRTIRVSYKDLHDILRPDFSVQTLHALFPQLNNSSYTNVDGLLPAVVWLPDGRSYKFRYNSYLELARVELPTGGAFEYDWDGGYNNGPASGAVCYDCSIYRRITARRVYSDGVNLESRMTIGKPDTLSGGAVQSNSFVETDQYDSASRLMNGARHYYFGQAWRSMLPNDPVQYPDWQEGKEYQTETLDSNGSTVLRRNATAWDSTAPTWQFGPASNPRIVETDTTLEPDGANQTSRQTFSYDQYNNPNDVYEYDYTGALLRHSHTDYLTTNGVNGAAYDTVNPNTSAPDVTATLHLRSLPVQVSVYDAAGERARTTYEYDNYTSDGNHLALTPRSQISGLWDGTNPSGPGGPNFTDPNFTKRGNATAITHFLLVNSSVTGSITAYAQYDVAANVLKAIDPRGYVTTFEYNDRFGSPDAEAESNTAPVELSTLGQASYAFPTKATNALGQIAYMQFDYHLGRPVDAEDTNGVVTSVYSDASEALDRPTRVIRAANKDIDVRSQSTFSYDDTNRVVTVTSDQISFNDNALKGQTVYDGLGRSIESRQYENSSQYIAVKQIPFVRLQDPDTGVWTSASQSSNPYRAYLGEQPVWTTSFFDSLGRGIKLQTPDNAIARTVYSGNTVTVSDQSGKQRKSVSDALGRLIQVYEDPNGLNYLTSYSYDALDDLTAVNQGSQTRSFVYDSLKRLTSAANPESGTIIYQYDENGNLRFGTDARGVSTEHRYDALNRVTTVLYRVNGQPDPNTADVEYLYDNATNGKGRLWLTFKWGARPLQKAVGGYDALGRATQLYDLFGNDQGGWYPAYSSNRTYDLAGNVKTQTYPSGHAVTYDYDGAGRTTSFTGNLGDGTTRTYSTGINYSPFGGMSNEQFGTTTPLYHKTFYNIRGQMFDTRLSSVNDTWDWNRGRLILYYSSNHAWGGSGTDNNGNLLFAENWIPPANATLDQAESLTEDSYTYDSLNRLSAVNESSLNIAGGGSWTSQFAQGYTYDRYGNRTINTGATWGGVNNKAFSVDAANNRLGVPSGQSGTMSYDAAGNLTTDTYSAAAVSRAYDAENRMTSETQANSYVAGNYTYDADGRRVKRNIGGTETWQVYGLGGELLAEYAQNGAAASPQKEYGYRNGQLLITTDAATGGGGSGAQPVTWTNAVGVTVTGNSLTATGNGWNTAGAVSTQSIASGDGYVETTVSETSTYRMIGLSHGDTNQDYSDIDFALYPAAGGALYVYEDGVYRGYFGNYATGDTLRVAVEGGVVKYRKNGTLLYTSTVAPTYPLLVDTSLYNYGSTLNNVVISGGGGGGGSQNASWTNTVGVTVTGNSLTATGNGWNTAGAVSTQSIASGDGYVETTVSETSTYRMIGLSHGDTNQDYSDIDFALYPAAGGALYVYEDGVYRGYFGNYATGDTLRVAVEGGVVKYRKNGTLLYTSTVAPTYPLLVDTSLYSYGSTLNNVLISGAGGGSSSSAQIHWLVTDQLGTPRMIFDQSGSLATASRHDYLPFGEELFAGGRTTSNGYTNNDGTRQRFTSYERDGESGLDYAHARYYANTQARFTSPDPLMASAHLIEPQSWNRYAYVHNNPVALTDPLGLDTTDNGTEEDDQEPKKPATKDGDPIPVKPNDGSAPGLVAVVNALKPAESPIQTTATPLATLPSSPQTSNGNAAPPSGPTWGQLRNVLAGIIDYGVGPPPLLGFTAQKYMRRELDRMAGNFANENSWSYTIGTYVPDVVAAPFAGEALFEEGTAYGSQES